MDAKNAFEASFGQAVLNPNALIIRGVICGYWVDAVENPLIQKVRCLDKLIGELPKGAKEGNDSPGGLLNYPRY